MKKIKLEWIHSGFADILCSDGVKNICEEQGKRIQSKANAGLTAEDTPGFETGGKIVTAYGSKRYMQFVHTTDSATMIAEQYDNVLSEAVN